MSSARIVDVRFEHFQPSSSAVLGAQDSRPRISWKYVDTPPNFIQTAWEIEVQHHDPLDAGPSVPTTFKATSSESSLVPWPCRNSLASRQRLTVRVRATGGSKDSQPCQLAWSEPAVFETGLLQRQDWDGQLIGAPQLSASASEAPQPEVLFRRDFVLDRRVSQAWLYITAQGVYEAEINGTKVGDHFLAPGWTAYSGRIQYQTYNVTTMLSSDNCIGIRAAEGWSSGRLGFQGGRRNLWSSQVGVYAQLEVEYADKVGRHVLVTTDDSWLTTSGPIQKSEIYDGEMYDARLEVAGWSLPGTDTNGWNPVQILPPFSDKVKLVAGFGEPVRRVETLTVKSAIITPSGKVVLDFGQNLVGHIRFKNISGPRGSLLTMTHAEVLEDGELGTRPLRACEAKDTYTLRGDSVEQYEPRFTYHGFRYVQVDGWASTTAALEDSVEAVVCHTDMQAAGSFSCSNSSINTLFRNIVWSMKGNFVSVPTDCPQRDERLGWTGDIALFAPTATFLYDCSGMLKNWLEDVKVDQATLGGLPPVVSPNVLLGHPLWGLPVPLAIWHDATVLVPWSLWEATGDVNILDRQYDSMETWLKLIPRNKIGYTHLWDLLSFQLGDWLDPTTPENEPFKSTTDSQFVANAFLIRCLDTMTQIATILGRPEQAQDWAVQAAAARAQFAAEFISPSGRLVSDTQTAYALAICFDLLEPHQVERAGLRLAEIVRRNGCKIGTGFAGTPYLCEALTRAGHANVAHGMLLNDACPSWLYPVSMGATTMWERWDSMLPDGKINPGEMTSFNHYAFGAVATYLVERVAGLRRLTPGWRRARIEPGLEGGFDSAQAEHLTRYGKLSCSWVRRYTPGVAEGENVLQEGVANVEIVVTVPPTVEVEVVVPGLQGSTVEIVGSGTWTFTGQYKRRSEWPLAPLPTLPL